MPEVRPPCTRRRSRWAWGRTLQDACSEEGRLSKALLYLSVKTRGSAPTGQNLAGGRVGREGGWRLPRSAALTAWPLPFVQDVCLPPHPAILAHSFPPRPSHTQTFWP